jgi:uncharacterized Fe-S cluster protein YjdI
MQIEWDENKCIHSGKCVQSLPEVFRIEEGSFIINPGQGSDEDIVGVVNQCPSKALKIVE